MKNFTKKMKAKMSEKAGAVISIEMIVIILIVLVIAGTLILPSLSKTTKKGFEAGDKKLDEIINYIG